ncbi:MAG: ACT domain-containing protein [Desulfobacterales bacterium]|nr:ACT domain-containing protein [Desulfobacterales bacterium]
MRSGEKSSVPYYMRFTAKDTPGVLSKVSGVLADYKISISSVIQKGQQENGYVPIVMLTHEAIEQNLKKAKAAIDRLAIIKGRKRLHKDRRGYGCEANSEARGTRDEGRGRPYRSS